MATSDINTKEISTFIKTTALDHGFSYCGIAKAAILTEETEQLNKWLSKGYQSNLSYMEQNSAKRSDPRLLMEGAESLIVMAAGYYPGENYQQQTKYKVSRYALGND